MLDQPKLDRGLSFFECRLRRVLTGSRFAVLRRGRHERLALHRLALLQAAQRSKRAKAPIELIYGGRFLDSAIPAIVTTWSEKELLDRASLEFITRLSLTNAEAHLSLTKSTKNSLKPLDPLTNNSDPNP